MWNISDFTLNEIIPKTTEANNVATTEETEVDKPRNNLFLLHKMLIKLKWNWRNNNIRKNVRQSSSHWRSCGHEDRIRKIHHNGTKAAIGRDREPYTLRGRRQCITGRAGEIGWPGRGGGGGVMPPLLPSPHTHTHTHTFLQGKQLFLMIYFPRELLKGDSWCTGQEIENL